MQINVFIGICSETCTSRQIEPVCGPEGCHRRLLGSMTMYNLRAYQVQYIFEQGYSDFSTCMLQYVQTSSPVHLLHTTKVRQTRDNFCTSNYCTSSKSTVRTALYYALYNVSYEVYVRLSILHEQKSDRVTLLQTPNFNCSDLKGVLYSVPISILLRAADDFSKVLLLES
jgi:hypothetical protein